MKKVFKLTTIYLSVILLALVATVIFCAGFLFFYRDGNIFGIQYIKKNEILFARESADMSNLQNIEIESGDFDVIVRVNSAQSNLIGAMCNKAFGYAIKSKAQPKFELEYNEATRTAEFSSVEPKGWLNKKDCYIEIAVPEDLSEKNINLKIKTNKGDIKIGGGLDWQVGTINIESKKGDGKVKNLTIAGDMVLKAGSGCFTIAETCESVGEIDAQLSVGSGTLDLTKIDSEKLKLDIARVVKNSRGQINILKTKELITNENINGGGKVQVVEVGFVDFASLDTNIYIKTITNPEASRIKITGNGKVFVNQVMGGLEVDANDGDIKINSAFGTLALSASRGDIEVVEALKLVSATTTYGNIEITFGDAALDYADTSVNDSNKNRAVIATTKNGHIIVQGLQNGVITATDSGRISLSYDRIVGDNQVVGKLGTVNIIVPHPATNSSNECAFNLKVHSEVSADIKVGVAGSIGRVDFSESGIHEFKNIYNSTSSTLNNLSVKTSTGPIKIRSLDLIKY